jgi:dihydrofolate synthase/folylpolyglutamate synthase
LSAYERALAELYALAGRGIVPGLERVRAAFARLGHPERAIPCVHVAGTNGKGSVSRMIATGVDARVGLFTSPHLHTFTERIDIGGSPITEDDVLEAWAAVRPVALDPDGPQLTFFECATGMALWLFARRGVELAVLEAGLGGRLDATNLVDAPELCVITRIGMDHERFLGDDLASIAREKAGILKPGRPAVIAPQRPEALAVLEQEAARVGAPLSRVGHEVLLDVVSDSGTIVVRGGERRVELAPRLAGAHQRDNAATAVAALWALEERGFAVDVRRAVETVRWPGRLERIDGAPPFLLDGAHNPDGCEALARHLEAVEERPRVLVFGAMADKRWPAMLAILGSLFDSFVFSAASLSRAERPETLAAEIPELNGEVAPDVDAAVARARELAGERGLVVVAGSLFLMAEVRARLLGVATDPPIAM